MARTSKWPLFFFSLLVFLILTYNGHTQADWLKEPFGASQPGTMVQLASTHVPTEEDEEEARAELRQISQDLRDLTEDPMAWSSPTMAEYRPI